MGTTVTSLGTVGLIIAIVLIIIVLAVFFTQHFQSVNIDLAGIADHQLYAVITAFLRFRKGSLKIRLICGYRR